MTDKKIPLGNTLENIVDSIDNLSIQQNRLAEDTLSRDELVQKGLTDTDQKLQEQINEINSGWNIDLSKNYPSEIFTNPPDISGEWNVYIQSMYKNEYKEYKSASPWKIEQNQQNPLFFKIKKQTPNHPSSGIGIIIPDINFSNKWYAKITSEKTQAKSELKFITDNTGKVIRILETMEHTFEDKIKKDNGVGAYLRISIYLPV